MRGLRGIFCIYVVVWFNLVVPGHTRGILCLPSNCHAAGPTIDGDLGKASCCAAPKGDPGGSEPTPLQKKNCAVCYVAATYTAVAWFSVDLDPTGELVEILRYVQPAIPTVDFPLTHYATGPPASA